MPGENRYPYQEPSGGYAASDVLRVGCFQARQPPTPIFRWRNVTKVPDFRLRGEGYPPEEQNQPVEPGGIAPYPRPKDVCVGGSVTAETNCYELTPGNVLPRCVNQDGGEIMECSEPDATHATVAENCYEKTNELLDIAACQRGWFKNVQAAKIWHGTLGWIDKDSIGSCGTTLGAECNTCNLRDYRPTGPNTKYLRCARHLEGELVMQKDFWEETSPGVWEESVSYEAVEVELHWEILADKDTGNLSLVSCAWTQWPCDDYSDPDHPTVWSFYSINPYDLFCGDVECGVPMSHGGSSTIEQYCGEGTISNLSVTNTEVSFNYDADDSHIVCTWTLSDPYTCGVMGDDPDVLRDTYALAAYWDMTDDFIYPWRRDSYVCVAPLVTRNENGAPANPKVCPPQTRYRHWCLASACEDAEDCVLCNPSVNLTDDYGSCTVYDGTPYPEFPPENFSTECWEANHQQPWTEYGYTNGVANSSPYDGAVIGAPNPAGYDSHFNTTHRTWKLCVDEGPPVVETWYVSHVGAWSGGNPDSLVNADDPSDLVVPKSATQWTENQAGNLLNAGGWIVQDLSQVIIQKWAESLILRPSHNWFRPAARDRLELDPDRAGCVWQITGTNTMGDPYTVSVHFDQTDVSGPTISTGTKCFYDNKIWTVTRLDDFNYELNFGSDIALRADQIELIRPAAETEDQSGRWPGWPEHIFAPLRWPTARAVGGRVRVLSATPDGSGGMDIEIEGPKRHGTATFLLPGDVLDFLTYGGMDGEAESLTDTSITVDVVTDATHFHVSAVLTGNPTTSTLYLKTHDAPHYSWWDDQRKFCYLYLRWGYNFRDYVEADHACEDFHACGECAEATVPEGITCINVGTEEDPDWQSNLRYAQTTNLGGAMPREVDAFSATTFTVEPACRMVACVSPNGENWSGLTSTYGRTHGFPSSNDVAPDGTTSPSGATWNVDAGYGGRWWGLPVQHVPDPLWKAPPKPCKESEDEEDAGQLKPLFCRWNMDNGTCQPNIGSCSKGTIEEPGDRTTTDWYYPHCPLVEARAEAPVRHGQQPPDLPAGIYWGALTLAEIAAHTAGNAFPPPDAIGEENIEVDTPWRLLQRQQECRCDDPMGRFGEFYKRNKVIC